MTGRMLLALLAPPVALAAPSDPSATSEVLLAFPSQTRLLDLCTFAAALRGVDLVVDANELPLLQSSTSEAISSGPVSPAEAIRMIQRLLAAQGYQLELDDEHATVVHDTRGRPTQPLTLSPYAPQPAPPPSKHGAIEQIGDHRYAIPRAVFEEQVLVPDVLAREGRAIPVREGDAIVGYRITAIRKDSLGDRLGFLNGDVLLDLAGQPLATNPERAFAALEGQTDFCVRVLRSFRSPEPIALCYEVR